MAPGAAGAWNWQGSVGAVSDKVVYGISQSDGSSSAVIDLTARSGDGWLLGAGLASLPAARGRAELNLVAGRGGSLGEQGAWQATATAYTALGSGTSRRPAYLQWGLAYAWNERLQLTAWLTPNQSGPAAMGGRTRGRVTVVEAGWHQPLAHRWAVDVGLGRVDYAGLAVPRYSYGSLGLSWGTGPLQVFVTRVFSRSASPAAAGPRAVVSVLASF
jgi:hypothetical protein